MLLNFSTWESVDALADFVYRSAHVDFLRRRREWFERLDDVVTVLWWVPRGHRPTTAERIDRLERLRQHGPTPDAFTFRQRFAPEGAPEQSDHRDVCPA